MGGLLNLCCCSLFCADLLIVGGHVEYFSSMCFCSVCFLFVFLQTSMVITVLFGEDFASCVDVLF